MKTLNTDDIFMRGLTIALLELLNEDMYFNLSKNDHKEQVKIPFHYNYGTDAGFLSDFYIGLPNNCKIPVAEGTYDQIPRGIVTLSSFSVKSSDLTNKFIRGNFSETERGENDQNILTGYSAQLFSIPLSVKFEIKVICDNLNKAFKIAEKFLDLEYANRVMYFQYNGIRIPSQFRYPDSVNPTNDKKYSFSQVDNNKINVQLTVDIETCFPSFERTSKRKSSNVMERINVNKEVPGTGNGISLWIDQNTPIQD